MTISRLPNGRWRARIWHCNRDVSVGKILGTGPATYRTKTEAKDAYAEARRRLRSAPRDSGVTVREWWDRWTTQPAYARPKQSTNMHYWEATRPFVDLYGHLELSAVTRRTVAEWRESGRRDGTIPALRAMWNDAIDKAGVTDTNPFARLGLRATRGNRDMDPPDQDTVWALIRVARKLTPPGFAAWLQVAAFTGMRPGELDALSWDCVDGSRVRVERQFSSVSRTFTLPKNGHRRDAPLPEQAREGLTAVFEEDRGEFCFTNSRREHWSATSRMYWWNMVRRDVGYEGSLYLATRHFAGAWMINELELSAEEVAIALGHEDGGRLVSVLYGHRDRRRTLERVVEAYNTRSNVVPLSLVRRAEES